MVDVNVTISSKASEKHVFKGRKPRKNKFTVDWEAKDKLKKSIVETIQQMQTTNPPLDLPNL
jgi:hypothetical protein